MFTWAKIPFVRIAAFFILGIVIHSILPGFHWPALAAAIVVIGLITFGLNLNGRIFLKANAVFGFLISILFLLLGYFNLWLHDQSQNRDNLLNAENISGYLAEVSSVPEIRDGYLKVVFEVNSVKNDSGWQKTEGKVLAYLEIKDSTTIKYADKLSIIGIPKLVSGPKNPNEFNYKRFLKSKDIFHTHWIRLADWRIIGHSEKKSILRTANIIRSNLETILEKSISNPKSLAIMNALVLGDKEGLDKETKTIFTETGVVHVLAVSGLHVGIIYLILVWMFKPLAARVKPAWLITALIIAFLWLYALITGLSPSVMRAVTMFSILEIGRMMNRQAAIFNSLALSAFILLWINPYLLTQVGFQLSYLAVTGILLLFKPISALYQPKRKVTNFFWQITVLSIAAQFATAPLVVYYFHQLPSYFLLSNLLVIPAVTVLVWGGVILLFIGQFSIGLAGIIGLGLDLVLRGMTRALELIAALPNSTISGLSLDWLDLILIYLILGLFIGYIKSDYNVHLRYLLTIFILLFGYRSIIISNRLFETSQIVFYSVGNNHWAIDLIENGQYISLSDSTLSDNQISYSINPYRLTNRFRASEASVLTKEIKDVGEIIVWNGIKILITRQADLVANHLLHYDYVLRLNKSPRSNYYSDQNLFIKLVSSEDQMLKHSLESGAYIAEF